MTWCRLYAMDPMFSQVDIIFFGAFLKSFCLENAQHKMQARLLSNSLSNWKYRICSFIILVISTLRMFKRNYWKKNIKDQRRNFKWKRLFLLMSYDAYKIIYFLTRKEFSDFIWKHFLSCKKLIRKKKFYPSRNRKCRMFFVRVLLQLFVVIGVSRPIDAIKRKHFQYCCA